MKKTRLMFILAIAVAMSAAVTSAQAAVETVFADYGSSSAPLAAGTFDNLYPGESSSQSLTLNKFNPSLGTLTGVTLTLFSYDTVNSEIYNFSAGSGTYTDVTTTGPATVTATLGGVTTTATPTAGPFANTAPVGLSVAGTSAVSPVNSSVIVNPSDFLLYEGAGGLNFSVTIANLPLTYSGSYGGSPLYFGGNAFSYGRVQIDYAYVAVPEPGTLCAGLAAIGFCGMNMARRFRLWA